MKEPNMCEKEDQDERFTLTRRSKRYEKKVGEDGGGGAGKPVRKGRRSYYRLAENRREQYLREGVTNTPGREEALL